MTTGLAGGMLCPYKGLLLAALASAPNSPTTASIFHTFAKAILFSAYVCRLARKRGYIFF